MIRPTAVIAALAALPLSLVAPSAATSGARTAPPATFEVTVTRADTQVEVSSGVVRIRGRVKPWAAGEKVHLLSRPRGTRQWTRLDSSRLTRTGRFVLRHRPSVAGVRYYRVFKPRSDALRGDRTPSMRVEVLRWERLIDQPYVASCGVARDVDARIGGVVHPDSLVAEHYAGACINYVEYDVQGRCRLLRATYGMTDESTSGASALVSLYDHDRQSTIEARHVTTGTVVHDHLTALDAVGRLRVYVSRSASNYPAGDAAVGTPEVLCLPAA